MPDIGEDTRDIYLCYWEGDAVLYMPGRLEAWRSLDGTGEWHEIHQANQYPSFPCSDAEQRHHLD